MHKGYKIRIYPTNDQEELLWKHIHACRFIWNYMLNLQRDNYRNGVKHMSGYDMIRHLTVMKKNDEYKWLYNVSNTSLQRICQDLNNAYQRFFNKTSRYPKFKSRKTCKLSYPLCAEKMHFNNDSTITLQKLGKVRTKANQVVGKYINPRITYCNGKWILSFSIDCEKQAIELTNKPMGIDMGVKELAVVSFDGECIKFHNIGNSKRVKTLRRKLKHINRVIARKYRTNGNYNETKQIHKYKLIAKEIYYKLSNIKMNYIHQITHQLISLRPNVITMEDLDLLHWIQTPTMATIVAYQGICDFKRQMCYKAEWNGIKFILADRYYPSSKTCSNCGNIKHNLRVSDRTYQCPRCGLIIDRDYNAAINLMKYGSQIDRLSA